MPTAFPLSLIFKGRVLLKDNVRKSGYGGVACLTVEWGAMPTLVVGMLRRDSSVPDVDLFRNLLFESH